jgi:hypothetical protein
VSGRTKTILTVLLGLGACAFAGACNTGTRASNQDWMRQHDGAYQAKVALESDSSDRRREAVNRLAKTKSAATDWAFETFDAIARTDRSESVRCAAVRAFQRFADERPVPTLLALMNQPANADRVRPISPRLQWECINALAELDTRGCVSDELAPEVVDALIVALTATEDRNVCIAAAEALSGYCDRQALDALIGKLRTNDFGVAYACELSLIRLTGQTHSYRADRWTEWLRTVDDPFAEAGQTPLELVKPRPNWWERTRAAFEGAALTWQGEPSGGE